MGNFLVFLDSTPASWQAAYTAFAIAVRFSAGLVGAVPLDFLTDLQAHSLLRSFESGAHAAGVHVISRLLPSLSVHDVLAAGPFRGVFISQSMAINPATRAAFVQLISNLPYPVWVAPGQRAISHSLVLYDEAIENQGVLRTAQAFARRLDLDLHLVPADHFRVSPESHAKNGDSPAPFQVDLLMKMIADEKVDLVFLGKPGPGLPVLEVCLSSPSLVVICQPDADPSRT